MSNPYPPPPALLEAIAFAARAHQGQLRKDGRTPYVSHVFRVCLVLRHVFGIDDAAVLTAAVLHDTIEDTTTDFDDVEERFGSQVASWVALLSKDKRQQDGPREEAYKKGLASAPWQVKACKLADVYDNLLDSAHLSPEKCRRTVERAGGYLKALDEPNLPPAIRRAFEIVQRLLDDLEGKP
jgi:guanosine-3',5'-bis(diphosphate) 3'-pyrophosphohydrolase